ncbi:MAG: hypothetical protein ABL903_13340 [Methylococcales bacterium]
MKKHVAGFIRINILKKSIDIEVLLSRFWQPVLKMLLLANISIVNVKLNSATNGQANLNQAKFLAYPIDN